MTGRGLGWWATGLELLFPQPCPGCGGDGPWCPSCAADLVGRLRSVRLSDSALDAATGVDLPPVRALTRYRGAVRAAILAGKEHGRGDLPPLLGAAIGRALARAGPRRPPTDRAGLWLVPAPSRRSSARRRGGDPVLAMARAAAKTLAAAGLPAGVAPCVWTASRARDSVGLDPGQRAANLSGRVRFRARAAPPVGARVVVVDDVVTSGSTVVATVRVLAGHGIRVDAAVAVATPAPWVHAR